MIFSEENYFLLNEIENYHLFNWTNTGNRGKVKIAYSIINGNAISIPKAPYSGIVCDGQLSKTDINQLIQDFIIHCTKQGAKKITIKQSPFFVNQLNQDHLIQALRKNGFEISEETNHHIFIPEFTQTSIHPMQIRRIKKCKKEGLTFEAVHQPNIEEYYDFFTKCRAQQEDVLNISKDHLEKLLRSDLATYELFCIRTANHQIIAALVLLTINPTTSYYFIPAFDRDYSHLSPLSFLLTELITLLKTKGVQYLDLGTSNKDSIAIDSLIKYKERMGGITSKRLVYSM